MSYDCAQVLPFSGNTGADTQQAHAHLEAGNFGCNVIILVQLGGLLQLGLDIIQRGLHLHMRGPGLVEVLAQGRSAQQAHHVVVESRHLLSQPGEGSVSSASQQD